MAKAVHCIFMGGLGGLVPPFYYSNGLKDLSARLRTLSAQIKTTILHHNEDELAWQTALRAHEAGAVIDLFGHSLGADSVRQLAARLHTVGSKGIPVGLIGSFDPTWNVWGKTVTANVARCLNFYNTSWFSFLGKKTLVAGPGFKGHLANIPLAALHQNVEDDLSAHSMLVREVQWQLDPSKPLPKPAPATATAEATRTQTIIANRKLYPGDDPREFPAT